MQGWWAGRAPVIRRIAAVLALVAAVLAVSVVVAVAARLPAGAWPIGGPGLVTRAVAGVAGVAGLLVGVPAGWAAAGRPGALGAVGVAAAGLTVAAVATAVMSWPALVLVLLFAGASLLGARGALRRGGVPWTGVTGWQVPPAAHGVLLANPRSGGGKVERFGLAEAARRRGVRLVLLGPGDDLRALAEQAAADGADVLGMAGGDGSQALVAQVAHAHGLAFVCVPAGTRNHFALDLGLDRKAVAAALDAFGEAVERRVDLATVGDRVFVNNASLGAYAAIVQSPAYRDAKVATAMAMLPEVLGPEGPAADLRYPGPDGSPRAQADVLMVSNNAYTLRPGPTLGTRPRLDTGRLGLLTVRARGPVVSQWTAETLQVEAAGAVPVGIDGEAVEIAPPLRFRSLPGALRVRLPARAAAASHTTTREPGFARSVIALLRCAAGLTVRATA